MADDAVADEGVALDELLAASRVVNTAMAFSVPASAKGPILSGARCTEAHEPGLVGRKMLPGLGPGLSGDW